MSGTVLGSGKTVETTVDGVTAFVGLITYREETDKNKIHRKKQKIGDMVIRALKET